MQRGAVQLVVILLLSLIVQNSFAGPKDYDAILNKNAETLNDIQNVANIPDVTAIYSLAELNNPQITMTVLNRLQYEVNQAEPNKELITELVYLLVHYSNKPEDIHRKNIPRQYDIEPFINNYQLISYLQKKMFERFGKEESFGYDLRLLMRELMYNTYAAIKEKQAEEEKIANQAKKVRPSQQVLTTETVEAPKPRYAMDENFVSPVDKLKKFRARLEANIIEQDEVIDAFVNWEFETLVKGIGNSKEQKIIYMAGLPGTGKDTSAEALRDAYYADQVEAALGQGRVLQVDEHMFMVGTQKSSADAWNLLGSVTGHVGSQNISPFIRYLVKHSAGKYAFQTTTKGGQSSEEVIINKDWKPGMVIDGYEPPEKAIIFLNEFHHWSQEAKDVLLKHGFEKGVFKINNPGSGESFIQLYGLRFVIASNELVDLITNRNPDGSRFGRPLSYLEMLARWKDKYKNKTLLKEALMKMGSRNTPNTPLEQRLGVSEAILSRIPSWAIILLKPISPEGLQKIARMKIASLNKQFSKAEQGAYGQFQVEATDELTKFVQEYDYVAEDGGRAVNDKIQNLVEHPFYQALQKANLKPSDLYSGVVLDVKKNNDKTYSLLLRRKDNGQPLGEQVISATLKELANQPISDEKIDHMLTLEKRLNSQVFGAKKAAKKIADAMLVAENNRHVKRTKWEDHGKATSFGFFGPSSTGKSEMAKAVVREIYPDYGEEKRVDIDFNKIQSVQALEEFIWGRKIGNEVHPSEFMKKYDQYNGDILFVFEETSNTPKELLRSLYDLFRENHPKFADGVDRPMTNVTIIMTGNAGIKWYEQVPKDVPIRVQIAAWKRIHEQSMKDLSFQRATLEQYYPEPLINRIGQPNIIWFAPLDFKAIRELSYLKLTQALKRLKEKDGGRGWDIGFRSQEDLEKTIEIIEREGFILYEQGASIDRYVNDNFENKLRILLLRNKVPSGKKIVIVPRDDQNEALIQKNEEILFDIEVENSPNVLELKAEVQKRKPDPKQDPNDQILTAAHEAGHEIVGKALLGDKFESDYISIIPGVMKIQDQWIYYAGVATKEEIEKLNINYESGVSLIAQLMAGFEGERAVSIGDRHSTGKSNDIERATQIAENMIVKWGLVPEWGFSSVDPTKMSNERMQLKEELIQKILSEGQVLAQKTLRANKELHLEMTRRLARKGEIKKDGLDELYSEIRMNNNIRTIKSLPAMTEATRDNDSHRVEIRPEVGLHPDELADITKVVDAEQQAEAAKAEISARPAIYNFPSRRPATVKPTAKVMEAISCERLFAF